MLEQIARVLFWLCIGEIASRSGLLPLPAPVTGLMLLYAELAIKGKVPEDLGTLADRILQFLGMLFVPAGVGVITYLDLLKLEAMPILASVIGGTAITIFVTAIVANRFATASSKTREDVSGPVEEVASEVSS
jgi:holin-like protein